ncbi:oligosaccharide flippase family protein [Anaerobacillus sp. MEB173]|uniref:putative polysaccharide biosynthesis protein n=1 Tax=Anaerobacillus sp. MEB173 TaxID=3383345 RepID=UPI003F93D71E
MVEKQTTSLLQGAVYLSIAVLLTKVMSAAYRIPYQNMAGDVGFYVYQQIYPIYGIALILATYGFPVMISKLVSEQIAMNNHQGARHVSTVCFIGLVVFGLSLFSLFFFSAELLAIIMADRNLIKPLQAISFSFLFIPFLAVLRGYFQGKDNMLPTAVSQVAEQAVRVAAILGCTYFLISHGYGPYAAGTGAAIGSVLGALIAITVLMLYKKRDKKNAVTDYDAKQNMSVFLITKRLFLEGFLICLTALVLVLFQFIDSMTMVRLLQHGGLSDSIAIVTKGIYDRGQPLIQLGTVVATALSLSIVPIITKSKARGDFDVIGQKAEMAIRVTLIIGIGAASGLAIVIGPTNTMLFTDSSGSIVLAILGISIIFSSIIATTAAIMQGLDHTFVAAKYIIIGLAVKLLLNLILLPSALTIGAALATVIGLFVIAYFNIIFIQKKLSITIIRYRSGRTIIISALIMVIATWLWKESIEWMLTYEGERSASVIVALTSVLIGAATYIGALLKMKVFTEAEFEMIPKAKKILRFIQKKEEKR